MASAVRAAAFESLPCTGTTCNNAAASTAREIVLTASRADETVQDIEEHGLKIHGPSYRSAHAEGPAGNYFGHMCEHLKVGSRHQRRPFHIRYQRFDVSHALVICGRQDYCEDRPGCMQRDRCVLLGYLARQLPVVWQHGAELWRSLQGGGA